MFKSWEELTEVERLQSEFSDFYKDVHGYRPRWMSDSQWNSEAWLTNEIRTLAEENKAQLALEQADAKANIDLFEMRVTDAMIEFGQNRATIIRWLVDGSPLSDFCYENSLPLDYLK